MSRSLIAVTACLCAATVTVAAPDIRTAVREAESLVADQRFADALEVNAQGRSACGEDRRCLTRAAFTEGWIYERWASVEDPAAGGAVHLAEALNAYQEALRLSPDSRQVRDNLVLVLRRIDRPRDAAELVESRLGSDAADFVLLGDLRREAGQAGLAARAYRQAIDAEPGSPVAYARLGQLYRRSDLGADVLMENVAAVRARHPSVAAAWFEAIMEREHGANERLSQEALVGWAGIVADQQPMTPTTLARLPAGWETRPVAELRDVVGGQTDTVRWWRAGDRLERRDALARVLRSVAGVLAAEDLTRAVDYLELGLDVTPDDRHYFEELRDLSNPRLDSAIDLLTLYRRIEADDKLRSLSRDVSEILEAQTERLFSGKGEGYRRGADEDVLRYHSVLGTLYYTMGQFESPTGWGPDSARFQLTHALRTADRLEGRGRGYRPLPHLAEALARVEYSRAGSVSGPEAVEARQRADEALVRAGREYLDIDDLGGAREALDYAKAEGAFSREPVELQGLERILDTREAVQIDQSVIYLPNGDRAVARPRYEWLERDDALGLPSDFVERQRFKVFADESARAFDAGDLETAEALGERARRLEAPSEASYSDAARQRKLDPTLMNVVPPAQPTRSGN